MHSGFSNVKRQTAPKGQADGRNDQTDDQTVDKAEEYSNSDVPGYNKLFIGTILLVGFLIYSDRSEN
jgi:hypothetical protein